MGTISDWELEGFGAPPTEHTALGVELVYRCYGNSFKDSEGNWHGSRKVGNCFWVFKVDHVSGPIRNLNCLCADFEAEWLEKNLNAALWNNTFHKVGMFRLHRGVKYQVGPIGQNTRGTQTGVRFAQTDKPIESLTHVFSLDFTGGPKTLLQVVLRPPWKFVMDKAVTLLDEFTVNGRERFLGARSNTWN